MRVSVNNFLPYGLIFNTLSANDDCLIFDQVAYMDVIVNTLFQFYCMITVDLCVISSYRYDVFNHCLLRKATAAPKG